MLRIIPSARFLFTTILLEICLLSKLYPIREFVEAQCVQ